MLRRGLLLTPLLLALAPVSAATAAPRPCTAGDLQGSRAPAMLRDHGLDTQDGALVAGTRYRVVVVQELAYGDNARPVDGSVAVTAPDGPPLEQGTGDGRPVYDFTPAAGTLRLTVTWQEEVGAYGSGEVCAASQSFDLPVLAPTIPRVDGLFSRGPHSFDSYFTLRLRGQAPQDPGTVTALLRARRGTTKPPAAAGRALARFTFEPDGNGGFQGSANTRRLARAFDVGSTGRGVKIYPYSNIAFGRTLRFAFSIEVLQHGQRIGGMSSGASCRRVQFSGHSAIKCRAVGLKQHP